eukprot:TRINITY_DN2516_c0_g1::TRINITY_DN2516_c0_g1_i1::g.19082::m.19082 TRINITY_DN2516_c0_g1::TRINITY_DN2516_c0_g1_i1::g.19082  ORF type:complete len:424 (-),score=21.17 TRINITY_DN2516_c0_g1_i1:331-1602(-)
MYCVVSHSVPVQSSRMPDIPSTASGPSSRILVNQSSLDQPHSGPDPRIVHFYPGSVNPQYYARQNSPTPNLAAIQRHTSPLTPNSSRSSSSRSSPVTPPAHLTHPMIPPLPQTSMLLQDDSMPSASTVSDPGDTRMQGCSLPRDVLSHDTASSFAEMMIFSDHSHARNNTRASSSSAIPPSIPLPGLDPTQALKDPLNNFLAHSRPSERYPSFNHSRSGLTQHPPAQPSDRYTQPYTPCAPLDETPHGTISWQSSLGEDVDSAQISPLSRVSSSGSITRSLSPSTILATQTSASMPQTVTFSTALTPIPSPGQFSALVTSMPIPISSHSTTLHIAQNQQNPIGNQADAIQESHHIPPPEEGPTPVRTQKRVPSWDCASPSADGIPSKQTDSSPEESDIFAGLEAINGLDVVIDAGVNGCPPAE